jgi:predicted alpha/beta superfamily hydrolase
MYTPLNARHLLIQPVDEHDLEVLTEEVETIKTLTDKPFALVAFQVNDWNKELTPWPAPPVFGKVPFGDGAHDTLQFIVEQLLSGLHAEYSRCLLGGYSLAGLFALWAGYRTKSFAGIVAASPSVWYPDWIDYARAHRIQSPAVYLSLGDREEKTKNPVMATVGNAIREMHEILKTSCTSSCLDWNPGNHFADSDRRLAKGIAWMLNKGKLH